LKTGPFHNLFRGRRFENCDVYYILFWRIIDILSTASWQDRGAAAVRGCRTERFRRSFVPTAIRLFNSDMFFSNLFII